MDLLGSEDAVLAQTSSSSGFYNLNILSSVIVPEFGGWVE